MLFSSKTYAMIDPAEALAGRKVPIPTADTHFLTGRRLDSALPEGMEEAVFGMGCFWGVERIFWNTRGVWLTLVGYGAGYTPNPTYHEVCSGQTGHNEVVLVVYDPAAISYDALLKAFFRDRR